MASSTSYSYNSTTNTADSGTTTGHRYSTSSTTDKDGTTVVRTARQDMGRPVVIEERRYNHTGQEDMLPPVAEVTEELGSSSMPSTPVGSDSGMALHALGGQEGSAWGPGLGRETTTETSETGTTRREYEDPSTGARLRKESEIDMSTVL